MKKSLLLLAAMAFTTASFAQTTAPATATQLPTHRVMRMGDHKQKTPEQSAEHHTAMLTKKLTLSADQQAKVRQIYLAQAQESQAMKAKYPGADQRKAMHQAMKADHDKYQAQVQAVLTADQKAKFVALKQEHHHKGGKGKVKS